MTADYTRGVGDLAHRHGLRLHIDGARIFNAAVAQGVNARALVEPADSVTFCLSKGLSAPVGSVLCGSKEFIARALRIRKQLGGGMRQAGILAAAGIVALETMVDRLAEDHARAKLLAQGLAALPSMVLDPGSPYTNMIFCSLAPEVPQNAAQVAAGLAQMGIKVSVVGSKRFRLVTHCWVSDEDVRRTVTGFAQVLQKG